MLPSLVMTMILPLARWPNLVCHYSHYKIYVWYWMLRSRLVTDREDDQSSLFYHYRDRADCENNFDELKNQWDWDGYTTKDVKICRPVSRMIALIYNWWNLYVRLALPESHHEAITRRPLLLTGVGRLTRRSAQKTITLTSIHGNKRKLVKAYKRLQSIFADIKVIAAQLTVSECWRRLLLKVMEKFGVKKGVPNLPGPVLLI